MSKLSTYPLDTAPALPDRLLGNDATVTSQFEMEDVVGQATSMKSFMPRNVRMGGDFVPQGAVGTVSQALVTMWFPIFVPEPCTLVEVSAEVTTLEVGSLVRLGLYTVLSITATGAVGNLVADYGTVAGDTTGDKAITSLSTSLTRGMYALCAASSSHTAVRWRKMAGGLVVGVYPNGTTSLRRTGTDYTGGLPATITATAWGAASVNASVQVLGKFT